MTDAQKELMLIILRQQDDMLTTHWHMLQIICPLPAMEEMDFDGQPVTLQ